MRYICAQPANNYYTWQVEVVINNFTKQGINPNQIDILCAINNDIIPEDWEKLRAHYDTVRFFFYNDDREDKSYIPSIYFNLMKTHMKTHPELIGERLFLHDSDIIFTRPPELSWVDDKTWYLSDTNSYINYDYIQQKGNHTYLKMCEIVGLYSLIPKLMNSNSGGAQYITIGKEWEFWDKIEKDSVKLYAYFCKEEPNYVKKHEGDHPIQKWTAGMWAFLWNIWKSGHETKVEDKLGFNWATCPIGKLDKYWILHNAGVTNNSSKMFFKADYINKLPYNEELEIDATRVGSYYWNEVKETGKISVLLQ